MASVIIWYISYMYMNTKLGTFDIVEAIEIKRW